MSTFCAPFRDAAGGADPSNLVKNGLNPMALQLDAVTTMAPTKRKTDRIGALAALALVSAAVLAGCTGLTGGHANQAPTARLEADRMKGWAGEEFTFDAQSSKDPDGNITSWAFDFGDGTKVTVQKEDDARVKHVYDKGGDYAVTVTVVDNGRDNGMEKKSDDATVKLSVNQRIPVDDQVVYAAPLNATQAGRHAQAFQVREGADRAEATLHLQSVLVAGSSQVRVRLMDPAHNVLAEQTVTVEAAMNRTIEFAAPLKSTGDHVLEIVAQSGGVRATGELRVLYEPRS
jgi:PKD repeat protein